jgi:hypothetical protein
MATADPFDFDDEPRGRAELLSLRRKRGNKAEAAGGKRSEGASLLAVHARTATAAGPVPAAKLCCAGGQGAASPKFPPPRTLFWTARTSPTAQQAVQVRTKKSIGTHSHAHCPGAD